eukprot:scaffold128459_cov18-Prasinocladus_malaysianus.AAC.1
MRLGCFGPLIPGAVHFVGTVQRLPVLVRYLYRLGVGLCAIRLATCVPVYGGRPAAKYVRVDKLLLCKVRKAAHS